MSKTTSISYCHATASAWYGCRPVSPGCANCFARAWMQRYRGDANALVQSKSYRKNLLTWNQKPYFDAVANEWTDRAEYGEGIRRRVLWDLSDPFDDRVPIEWLADALDVVRLTSNLRHLWLTKRPYNVMTRIVKAYSSGRFNDRAVFIGDWMQNGNAPHNLWLGVSVENQEQSDKRLMELLRLPAAVRWVSAEPLLSPVNFSRCLQDDNTRRESTGDRFIDWMVVGGESGGKRRDCGVEAIVDVARQCQAAGVPVWVKQDCALRPGKQGRIPDEVWNLKQLPEIGAALEQEEI